MRDYSASLKSTARNRLLGRFPRLMCAFLLVGLVSYAANRLLNLVFPAYLNRPGVQIPYYVSQIIVFLLLSVLSAGMNRLFLNLCRNQDYPLTDLFFGFSSHPDRIIVANLLILLIAAACMLPFVGCMTAYVQTGSTFWLVPAVAAGLGGIAADIYFMLCYALIGYLYADNPEKDALSLLRESRGLMRGNKGRLLYLYLSFIGLLLLGLLSLGIGLLWICPYLYTVLAYFYLDIIHEPADTQGSQGAHRI